MINFAARSLFNLLKTKLLMWMLGSGIRGFLVDAKNGILIVAPDDFGVGRELRTRGEYGVAELNRIKKYLHGSDCVLIVGTHIGALAVPISKSVDRIIGIEANPITCDLARLNFKINDVANGELHCCAAGKNDGTVEFLISRVNSGGSKIKPKISNYCYYYDSPAQVKVPMKKLDSLLEGEMIDVILMDIEGSEFYALEGMQHILSRSRCLIVEFIPHHLKMVARVSVKQFLNLILPHFDEMYVPSKNLTVGNRETVSVLEEMYKNDEADDGIIFTKFKKNE